MSEPIPVHTGMRRRRFRTPDFADAIPDGLQLQGGNLVVNPEWESAEYEEVFFDKNKKPMKAATRYELFRELNARK